MSNFDLNLLKKRLENRGFNVFIADDSANAIEIIKDLAQDCSNIGVPGSVTIRQIGIIEELEKLGKSLVCIEDQSRESRLKQLNAEMLLTSSNAVSMEGFLVNLDGTGNRVAAMCYGPQKVISVIGTNKITENLEKAIYRVKNVAAPLNYQRKNAGTPCQKTGRCHECTHISNKQCRVLVIHEGKPRGFEDFNIIIVRESLGY